jgi:DNA-directed RNA polymerase subunit RPC12/RpoP
MNAIEPV